MTSAEILKEIYRIEADIERPENAGKISALKAYHRKLFALYMKSVKAA